MKYEHEYTALLYDYENKEFTPITIKHTSDQKDINFLETIDSIYNALYSNYEHILTTHSLISINKTGVEKNNH